MDPFNKVHIFEPMKSHIYEQNISVISLVSLIFNHAKPQMLHQCPFCGATGILCFGFRMTLPMRVKAKLGSSSSAHICCLCATMPKLMTGLLIIGSYLIHLL